MAVFGAIIQSFVRPVFHARRNLSLNAKRYNRYNDFVQLPDVSGLMLSAAQLPRNGGLKLRNPSVGRFV